MGDSCILKIGDIITLEYGKGLKNYRSGEGKFDVFGTNGKIGLTDEFIYDKPSIIIGRKGAYREVHLAKFPFFVIDTAFYTKKKIKDLDNLFLYYWFKNVDINQMDSGSAIPSTSRDEVYDLDINLPLLPEQKAIASVLSSIDDKIDLLHRQDKILEAMAETLFRQWFVEEAQEDWAQGTLDDCLELIIDYRGKTPKKLGLDWSTSGIPAISAKNIKNGRLIRPETFKYVDTDLYKKWMKDELQNGDIIMTSEAPLGELYLLNSDFKLVLSQRLFGLRPKKELSSYFLFCFLRSQEGQYLIKRRASGSTVQGIRQSELRKVEIVQPPEELVKKFDDITDSYFIKIQNNNNQTRTLEKLRDTLLPNLMSGEVRVEYEN